MEKWIKEIHEKYELKARIAECIAIEVILLISWMWFIFFRL